jgi:excisionase family DNA binding protein
LLQTSFLQLAGPGRAAHLRLVPEPGDAAPVAAVGLRYTGAAVAPGTRAGAAGSAALTLIYGSREEPERYLTVVEVAAMLRVSRATVYRLVHAGHLPGIRVGRSVRVSRDAVQKYLRDAALGGPEI